MGMRMSPEDYFQYKESASPPLFYESLREERHEEAPRRGVPVRGVGYAVVRSPELSGDQIFPMVQRDYTALIVGVVAVVAVVGIVVLGLAFLSRK